MKKIIFIYSDKANYPELKAYKEYFSKYFSVKTIEKKDLQKREYDNDTILWFIMGFYPERYKAGCIIHDYRSLSVGRHPKIKNLIKKYLNQQPHARIFLNSIISKEMSFSDRKPEFFIDMGVPKSIIDYCNMENKELNYDFIYVGDVSFERESHILIENFIKAYGDRKNIALVGSYERSLYSKYSKYQNIHFFGRVPQEKVFELISKADICVNFIPNKYPYTFQTSTKLLEYAAMKKKIISNKTPSILESLQKYSINSLLVDGYKFPSIQELSKLSDNSHFKSDKILWEKIIEESGIEYFLSQHF